MLPFFSSLHYFNNNASHFNTSDKFSLKKDALKKKNIINNANGTFFFLL
jgi:hypothetical protein